MPLYEGDVSEYVQSPEVAPVDLTITIGGHQGDGGHPVSAVVQHGEPSETTFARPPVEWDRTEPSPMSNSDFAHTSSAVPNTTAVIGIRLFDALFSGRLRRTWAEAVERAKDNPAGLRITISSSHRSIHSLAWELLYDQVLVKGYIASTDGWVLLRSVPDQPALPKAVAAIDRLRVLVIANKPDNPAEVELLREALPGARIDELTNPSPRDITSAMGPRRPDIVHFSTAGVPVSDDRQRLSLGRPKETELVSATALLDVMRDRLPKVVLLASDSTDVFAAELAREIPCVIGLRGSPPEPSRDMFIRGFYGALGQGSAVYQAVSAGRAQQTVFARALGADWAAPVAYLAAKGGIVSTAPHTATASFAEPVGVPSQPTASAPSSPKIRQLHLTLEMHEQNRDALVHRWETLSQQRTDWPAFIKDQVEQLETLIGQTKAELGESP